MKKRLPVLEGQGEATMTVRQDAATGVERSSRALGPQSLQHSPVGSIPCSLPPSVKEELTRSFDEALRNVIEEDVSDDELLDTSSEFSGEDDVQVSGFGGCFFRLDTPDTPVSHCLAYDGVGKSVISMQTENQDSAYRAVSALLEQTDKAAMLSAMKSWKFEFLSGRETRMVLRLDRQISGFVASIQQCQPEYLRQDFIDELNRRLEEKSYHIEVAVDEN